MTEVKITHRATPGGTTTAYLILALIGTTPVFAAEATAPADLVVHVTGFAHDRGQAVANLFREGEDVLRKPLLQVKAKVANGESTLMFPALAYGEYAISVFHDENGNGDLDHNFLHLPAEPLGFSNGFRFGVFSGLPSFEKLRITFGAGSRPVEIRVR